jgi:hypothetical protein
MHHRKKLVAALAAVVGLTVLGTAPAQARAEVTIKKIPTKSTPYKKPLTLKPRVSFSDSVVPGRTTLTVKKGKKTIAKNKRSVKLKAGKYKVTTNARYRTLVERTRTWLVVPAGGTINSTFSADNPFVSEACSVVSYRSDTDFNISCSISGGEPGQLSLTDDDIVGYTAGHSASDARYKYVFVTGVRTPVPIHKTLTDLQYSPVKTVTRTQTLKVRAGKKPAPPVKCATYKNYKKVRDGMYSIDVRKLLGRSRTVAESGDYSVEQYKPCKKGQVFQVTFDGLQVDGKSYVG